VGATLAAALDGQIGVTGQVDLVQQLEQVRSGWNKGESSQPDRKELDHTQVHAMPPLRKGALCCSF
jgi:hypothetical protein